MAYYQDNTDQRDNIDSAKIRAGHYQALLYQEDWATDMETNAKNSVNNNKTDNNESAQVVEKSVNVVAKIKSEEKIIDALYNCDEVLEPSLTRLKNLKTEPDDLLKTDICSILYNKVYPCHDSGTKVGILCRKLIKKYFKICKSDPMLLQMLTKVMMMKIRKKYPPKRLETYSQEITTEDLLQLVKVARYK